MTGCPSAGKSTIARELQRQLGDRGEAVEILDGDEVRRELSQGLGFSREDRDINVGRLAYVATLLARNGVWAVVAAVSPYAAARAAARERAAGAGVRFVEVFVDAPRDVLVARDVKGLYRRALSGELPRFTGVSDPYERPTAPDLTLRTDQLSLAECVRRVLEVVRTSGDDERGQTSGVRS
jgi:adenylylsulfate kinase